MSSAAAARLAARVSADYASGGHRTYFTPDLNDAATVAGEVANDASSAASSASTAAASLAAAQAIVGATQGVGTDGMDVPQNATLGSAARADANRLRGRFYLLCDSNYQILPQDFGKLLVTTSGTRTWTLPLGSDLPEGWTIYIKNRSGNNLTINRSGSDGINAAATSITIATGASATITLTSSSTFESY